MSKYVVKVTFNVVDPHSTITESSWKFELPLEIWKQFKALSVLKKTDEDLNLTKLITEYVESEAD
jgi:hypothetical protein